MNSAAMVENIRLRVSFEQKRSITVAARRRGLTVSEFLRELASKAAGVSA